MTVQSDILTILADGKARAPAAIAAAAGVDVETAVRVLGALTQPPGRVARVAPAAGETCWWYRAAGRAVVPGSTSIASARSAEATTQAELAGGKHRPAGTPAPTMGRDTAAPAAALGRRRGSTATAEARARIIATLRAQGPLHQTALVRAASVALPTLVRLRRDGVGDDLRIEVVHVCGVGRFLLYALPGQDVAAAMEALAAAAATSAAPAAIPTAACRPLGTAGTLASAPATFGEGGTTADADKPGQGPRACRHAAAPEADRDLVRRLCLLRVPNGAWGIGVDLVVRAPSSGVDLALLEAHLADPAFDYELITRCDLPFVRRRDAAATA